MKKLCLDCGSVLVGRSDKKFCSDYCRSNYHNHRNKSTNNYIRRINYALRKNRRILKKYNQRGVEKVERKMLVREGFDFEYVTHVIQNSTGSPLYFCYDHGYHYVANDLVELVKRKEEAWIV